MKKHLTKNTDVVKAIFYFIILFAGAIVSNADNAKVNIPELYKKNYVLSPEMNALKYQYDFPVNYSTGTVDIKIPLYTIECGELTLPIYLSYISWRSYENFPNLMCIYKGKCGIYRLCCIQPF